MSQRVTRTEVKRRRRTRRLITLAWVVALGAIVIFLLYKEKADWLYVAATLGLTGLLLIVAFSDLGADRKGVDEASLGDDAAAIGSGITGSVTAVAQAPSDYRGPKPRRK